MKLMIYRFSALLLKFLALLFLIVTIVFLKLLVDRYGATGALDREIWASVSHLEYVVVILGGSYFSLASAMLGLFLDIHVSQQRILNILSKSERLRESDP